MTYTQHQWELIRGTESTLRRLLNLDHEQHVIDVVRSAMDHMISLGVKGVPVPWGLRGDGTRMRLERLTPEFQSMDLEWLRHLYPSPATASMVVKLKRELELRLITVGDARPEQTGLISLPLQVIHFYLLASGNREISQAPAATTLRLLMSMDILGNLDRSIEEAALLAHGLAVRHGMDQWQSFDDGVAMENRLESLLALLNSGVPLRELDGMEDTPVSWAHSWGG